LGRNSFGDGNGHRNSRWEVWCSLCRPLLVFPPLFGVFSLLGLLGLLGLLRFLRLPRLPGLPLSFRLGFLLSPFTLLLFSSLASFALLPLSGFFLPLARLLTGLLLPFFGLTNLALVFFPFLIPAETLGFLTLAFLLLRLALGLSLLPFLFGFKSLFFSFTSLLGSARCFFCSLFGLLSSLLFRQRLLLLSSPVLAPLGLFSLLGFSLGVLLILGFDFLEKPGLTLFGNLFAVCREDPLLEHPSSEDLEHPPPLFHSLPFSHGILFRELACERSGPEKNEEPGGATP
jgi:hypothetical protein